MSNFLGWAVAGREPYKLFKRVSFLSAFLLGGCVSVKDYQLFILVHVEDQSGRPVQGANVILWEEIQTTTTSAGCAFIGGKVGRVDPIKLQIKTAKMTASLGDQPPGYYETLVVLDEYGGVSKEKWRRIDVITQSEWEKVCY